MTEEESRGLQNRRPTIGLLTYAIGGDPNSYPLWLGVYDVAQKQGANLICFPGNPLRSPIGFDAQANVLYDLAGPENVDGLVIWGSILAHHADLEEVRIFCEGYRPLPMANVATVLAGIPSVWVDNYQGMRDITLHLVEAHGCRRIAYICGPAGHPEAEKRYRGYADALAQHGLPLDPSLVVPGDFKKAAGVAAIALLLDQRKLRPQVNFEAVVAANDMMAFGAMEALRARGMRVPIDLAVVGFDDIEESLYTMPPLTTARQPYTEMGRQATEMVLAQLRGEEVPPETIVSSKLVVRHSCGCLSPATLQAAAGPLPPAGETGAAALTTHRGRILSDMVEAAGGPLAGLDPEWAGQLLDAFAAQVAGPAPGTFLPILDKVLHQVAAEGGDVAAWQGVLSALRRDLLAYLDSDALPKAEDLWQQARVLVGETAQQVQAYRREQAEQQAKALRETNQALITTFNIPGLMDALAAELPRLGIRRGYLCLYEDPHAPAQWSRLLLAYDEEGRAELETGGQRFPSRQLLPADLLPHENGFSLVVEPLYFREQQLGLALFEASPHEGQICDSLHGQVSSALQGALLVQQVESRALQLQTAAEVSRTASTVLDLDRLTQRVVDLVCERFELYYVGLFLVDETGEWSRDRGGRPEPGKWAVLRAGTGEAGRQMVAQGYKLEIGGNSMVGWCIANQQARIAGEAATEEMRLANPLLPETRSEMVLPLQVGERMIGALDVQARRAAAFDQDDRLVFQTMADQLAVAIENARAVAEMRRLNEDLQCTLDTQERLVETIRALSTPVMPLAKGVALLPLVGHIDTERAQQVMDQLLAGVQLYRARVAIVDITGVPLVDTAVASSLLRAAQAANLLGAEVVLVGIRPEVAQTIVTLGLALEDLVTMSDLQSGIEYAWRRLGLG